jgi:hypothetical protein
MSLESACCAMPTGDQDLPDCQHIAGQGTCDTGSHERRRQCYSIGLQQLLAVPCQSCGVAASGRTGPGMAGHSMAKQWKPVPNW